MKTQLWLVSALSAAIVGSIPSISFAKPPTEAPGGAPDKPPATVEEEGPFAPKGRTGKLREEAPAPAEEKEAMEIAKPGSVGLDLVVGFGKTGNVNSPSSVTVFSFLFGGAYHVKPNILIGARFPLSTGSITPGGTGASKFSSTAIGNVELAGTYEYDIGPHTKLPIGLALEIPTAGGDPFSGIEDEGSARHYAVNQAAEGARGFEENQLFEGHRFGIVPGAALEYGRHAIHTGAFTKVPFLLKAGGVEPDPGGPTLNPVSVEWVTGGRFFYTIVEGKVDIGARAWVTYFIKDVYDVPIRTGEQGPAKLNFVVEPSILARFGAVHAGLGFIWPIGGRAGGDVQMNGLRLAAAYVF